MGYILGPQQRKKVYENMLEKFEEDIKYKYTSGFCALLCQWQGVKGDIEYYPELLAQKPKGMVFGCYWWPIGEHTKGRERRIEALKKAIRKVNKLL